VNSLINKISEKINEKISEKKRKNPQTEFSAVGLLSEV
jgi:hypothetical protein